MKFSCNSIENVEKSRKSFPRQVLYDILVKIVKFIQSLTYLARERTGNEDQKENTDS